MTFDQTNIARHFVKSLDSYDKNAQAQRLAAAHLIRLLPPWLKTSRLALEAGCGTGLLTTMLCRRLTISCLWLNDLLPQCVDMAAARIKERVGRVDRLPGDIAALPLPDHLDLFVSASSLQWLDDTPSFLRRAVGCLAPGGVMAFTLFCRGTMKEFANLTGVAATFPDPDELVAALSADMRLLSRDFRGERLYFADAAAVLRHIQATGVGGVGGLRWTPGRLRRFAAEYAKRFADDQGFPLTYKAFFYIAEKK
jgi:malonyl-CoA O-methyltransferase